MRISVLKINRNLIVFGGIMVMIFASQGFRTKTNPVADTISDFSLRNVDAKYVSLKDYPDAKGFIIVFICNHCPFSKLYTSRLNELNAKYKELHVPLLAINSMDTTIYEDESFTSMRQRARAGRFNFPYLHDPAQTVLKDFKADRTPRAYVIWKENNQWTIEYSGAIDDNGFEPGKITQHYAADAVDELLQGKQVTTPETHSVGCSILYRKS